MQRFALEAIDDSDAFSTNAGMTSALAAYWAKGRNKPVSRRRILALARLCASSLVDAQDRSALPASR